MGKFFNKMENKGKSAKENKHLIIFYSCLIAFIIGIIFIVIAILLSDSPSKFSLSTKNVLIIVGVLLLIIVLAIALYLIISNYIRKKKLRLLVRELNSYVKYVYSDFITWTIFNHKEITSLNDFSLTFDREDHNKSSSFTRERLSELIIDDKKSYRDLTIYYIRSLLRDNLTLFKKLVKRNKIPTELYFKIKDFAYSNLNIISLFTDIYEQYIELTSLLQEFKAHYSPIDYILYTNYTKKTLAELIKENGNLETIFVRIQGDNTNYRVTEDEKGRLELVGRGKCYIEEYYHAMNKLAFYNGRFDFLFVEIDGITYFGLLWDLIPKHYKYSK